LQSGNYQTGGFGTDRNNSGLPSGGSAGGSGMIALGSARLGGSAGSTTGSYSGGGLFSSTSPSATTEGVMQKGTSDFGNELADPNGDPTGNPIPAGDGFKVLILFGLLYGYFKYRQNQKTITH